MLFGMAFAFLFLFTNSAIALATGTLISGTIAMLFSPWRTYAMLSIIFLIFGILGAFRTDLALANKDSSHISHFVPSTQAVMMTGNIVDEADIREDHIKYTVEISQLNGKGVHGKILIKQRKFPLFQYGDVLKIQGKLEVIPDEADFSYKNYLSRYEIYGLMSNPKMEVINYYPQSQIMAWLLRQKQGFLDAINAKFPDPESSFLAGLLIGAKKGMSDEITQEFRITGLAHVVAVSGSNITMILAVLITIFSFLPRIGALVLSMVTIVVFTLFVGASSAVVRAAVMGTIALMVIHSGRPRLPLMMLLLTSVIMALYQPKILAYDVGFQLSLSAVIGVIWLVPLLPKFLQKLPEQFGVREAILLTIAAQITTLPISVFHFHTFSLIAPLANLFILPLIPFAMLFGFIALFPLPFIGFIFQVITYFLLKTILFITHILAGIPYAQIQDIQIPICTLMMYSLGLCSCL
jgi:competence protein ComEC